MRPDGRQWPSLRWTAAGLAVALAAGLGGWAVANRIAADPAVTTSEQKVLDAGPAHLKVSGGWARAPRAPVLPGLDDAPAFMPYSGLTTTVSVALLPADSATLVPAELEKQAEGGLPKAETARVVGLRARAYRGVQTRDSVLDIYAIPTTRGVLTIVCAARSGASEGATWCLEGLDQITVEGARPITLNDGTAYRMRAPAVLKDLDAVRVEQRVALRRAKGPVGQERAARALWKASVAASTELQPLAVEGEASEKVVAALRETASAYHKLSIAADHRSKRGWTRARSLVARAEKELKAGVAAA
jgi:hypothetical protein